MTYTKITSCLQSNRKTRKNLDKKSLISFIKNGLY